MTLEELKTREAQLWAELQEMEKPVDAKRSEWSAAAKQIQNMEEREKLRAELLAELEKKKELQHHGARVETEMAKNDPNTI